jgi:ADP-heptose:LPS heptosyltransferase
VLVARPDNIGDVVMLGPALRALQAALPGAHLTLMASPAGAQAAPLLPWIDEVFTWRVAWQDVSGSGTDSRQEWALVERLEEGRFDAAILFTSFSQTPHPPAFACYLAGVPRRLGEPKEAGGGELTHAASPTPTGLHQVERNLHLIESAGFGVADRQLAIHIPEAASAHASHLLAEEGLEPGAPYLLLSPWTSCQARTYFPERFGAAAARLAGSLDWPVVVVGRERDRERSRPVLEPLGERGIDVIGRTSVPDLAALVAGARLVLTNNTLALHLADAVRTSLVVVYSGTDLESQWRPRQAASRILRHPTPCSPCYLLTCPYDRECMDISPAEVAAAGMDVVA